ncbi:hypothetical protein [Glycomyces tenuis]|nr:hypothetical protein [Glycomyces tenuis]
MAAALIDSELHCALEGAPISVQRAARVGDFFAALCRSVGSEEDAHADTGISPGELLHLFHEDERLEEAKRLLSLYLRDIVEAEARQYTHISDLLVDRAIELLEGGASIQEARERLGISEAGIYRKAERHPELAAAMECAADRYRRRGFDAVLFDEIAAMIEGGMSIVAAARRAGVSSKTLRKYRSEHPVLDQAMTVAAARHGR